MIDFDELYEKYGDMLYKIAFLYFGNKHDAEDALQEVFVKALLKIPSGTDSHQKAWLIRVTQNQCKDMLKKAKNIDLCIDDVIVDCVPEHINNERRIDILQKIINLPPKQKIIVILYYYYDYSVSQIASTLKISESNVKVRLKRGRNALKLELEGYDDEIK